MPAKKDVSALANISAPDNALGQGRIEWTLEVYDGAGRLLDTVTERAPIPVREPGVYRADHEVHVLAPGETRAFENTTFFDDERLETDLTVGMTPVLQLYDALEWVIGYPHGCLEQTTSRVLPMYLLRENADFVEETLLEGLQLDTYLHAGIDRLFRMQTAGGGLGFWPGAVTPQPYSSVYAAHFLALIDRDRRLPLPEKSWDELKQYIGEVALRGTGWDSNRDLYIKAYATYVLALAGDLTGLELIERFNAFEIPESARQLLAAALAIQTEDAARVEEYLANAPSIEWNDRTTRDTFNSTIRNQAVSLLAEVHLDRDLETLRVAAQPLLQYIKGGKYRRTHDMAFAIAAVGMYLSKLNASPEDASATIDGPNGRGETTGKDLYRDDADGAATTYTIANTGQVPMYVNLTRARHSAEPRHQCGGERPVHSARISLATGRSTRGSLLRTRAELSCSPRYRVHRSRGPHCRIRSAAGGIRNPESAP